MREFYAATCELDCTMESAAYNNNLENSHHLYATPSTISSIYPIPFLARQHLWMGSWPLPLLCASICGNVLICIYASMFYLCCRLSASRSPSCAQYVFPFSVAVRLLLMLSPRLQKPLFRAEVRLCCRERPLQLLVRWLGFKMLMVRTAFILIAKV